MINQNKFCAYSAIFLEDPDKVIFICRFRFYLWEEAPQKLMLTSTLATNLFHLVFHSRDCVIFDHKNLRIFIFE